MVLMTGTKEDLEVSWKVYDTHTVKTKQEQYWLWSTLPLGQIMCRKLHGAASDCIILRRRVRRSRGEHDARDKQRLEVA